MSRWHFSVGIEKPLENVTQIKLILACCSSETVEGWYQFVMT